MPDKRKNNGGHSTKAKRPNDKRLASRDEKLKVSGYAISAIEKEYGSIEQFWAFIAKESVKSKDHLKYLVEYAWGKAPQTVDHGGKVQVNNVILNQSDIEQLTELDDV